MKSKFILLFCFAWSIILQTSLFGQKDSSKVVMDVFTFNLGLGYDMPGGDLQDRFGQSLNFNTGFEYLVQSKFSFGADFTYIFGDKVKEDVFLPYRTDRGYVLGLTGYGAEVFLRQRGGYLGLNSGIWLHGRKNAGLKLVLGGGMIYHQIRILDDSRSLVLADEPYRKGYDRLCRGFALKQEILYQIHAPRKSLHLNIGFTITQGFTTQVREVNFDTGLPDDRKRTDLLYGFKVAWQLPLYKSTTNEAGKGEIKYY